MKSSRSSCEMSNKLLQECFEKIPGFMLRNHSVTTSSIYCRMPDGYSLRIGDHKGREKYSYKYNLDPKIKGNGYWSKEYNKIDKRDYWRYYTGNVDDLVETLNSRKWNKEAVK
jgi:hypothetical protein